MDYNGRPEHIEDFLVKHRTGQWFGWSDSKNKVYENLIVHDGGSKPTEQECTDGLWGHCRRHTMMQRLKKKQTRHLQIKNSRTWD